MYARFICFFCWFAAAIPVTAGAQASQNAETDLEPQVRALGGERYQVGKIVIDKAGGNFKVPGKVLRLESPLEYLAVTVGGAKAYESLLELDATAAEFNLACILIGLDNENVVLPRYQFDTEPVVGPAVRITASVQVGGEPAEVNASELLLIDGEPSASSGFSYTGSFHLERKTRKGTTDIYMAEFAGTLIGLAHDPASVIEHRDGIGIGAYGSISGNVKLLSAVDTPITLTIQNADR